jgi:hypothetical protein
MAYVYALGRIVNRAHDRSIRDTDIIIARSIEADPGGLGGPGELWGSTDGLTTSIQIGTGSAVTSITIGGGAAYTGTTVGLSGITDIFLGNVQINGILHGLLNGTGLIVGEPGAAPSTGSAIQIQSFTTAQRNFLSILPGMEIFNSTERMLQASNGVRWGDIASNNYSGATVDPTTTDDVNAGYDVGSHWINTVTQNEFVCVSNTAGSAVWVNETAGAGSAGSETVTQINGDSVNLVIGMPVYSSSPGTVKRSQANNQAKAYVMGLVYDTLITPTNPGRIMTDGPMTATTAQWDSVTGQVGGLTPNAIYYLDPFNLGKITTTPPNQNVDFGKFVIILGQALDITTFDIRIEQTILL